MSLDRALALIALALDPAASVEESRTAAVAACRLIAKGKLLNGGGSGSVRFTDAQERSRHPQPKPWGPPPKKAKRPRKNKPEGHHQNPGPTADPSGWQARRSSVGTPESRRAMYRGDVNCEMVKMGAGKVLCGICHTFIPIGTPAFYWPNRRPFENTVHSGCLW